MQKERKRWRGDPMARKHETKLMGKKNTFMEKAVFENTVMNKAMQAVEQKSRKLWRGMHKFLRDPSLRKKE